MSTLFFAVQPFEFFTGLLTLASFLKSEQDRPTGGPGAAGGFREVFFAKFFFSIFSLKIFHNFNEKL